MDRVTAERIAAATAGVTYRQAAMVIDEVLRQLGKCDLCQDTGRFTFTKSVSVELRHSGGHGGYAGYLPAGTETDCPRCLDGDGDPRWVGWYCVYDSRDCALRHRREAGWAADHPDCGWRVRLPRPKRGSPVPPSLGVPVPCGPTMPISETDLTAKDGSMAPADLNYRRVDTTTEDMPPEEVV